MLPQYRIKRKFVNVQVNQGHQSQYGIQYLTQLLQQYETQARLNYYLQQAGLGDYQAQTNQAVGQALQQQSGE